MTDYVLVPREPTEEMIDAIGNYLHPIAKEAVWKQMLAAAPSPWQPIETAPYEARCLFYVPNYLPHEQIGRRVGETAVEADNDEVGYMRPTHWMPLPPPPAE